MNIDPATLDRTVFRLFERGTDNPTGAYSRAYHTEYEFASVDDARSSNVHGLFSDPLKYRVAQYRVTYELINADVDL